MFYRHLFVALLYNRLLGRLIILRRHWNWMKNTNCYLLIIIYWT